MSTKLNVEFFHDVICSFCYPMSARMRKVAEEVGQLNIIHRSFVLAADDEALISMFGSLENAKQEIMSHWDHANQNDELHRFNVSGMRQHTFPFPTSLPGLKAAKAAGILGGDLAYWNVFDALQKALFTDTIDIADEYNIFDIIKNTNLDFEKWKTLYTSKEVADAIQYDLTMSQKYDVHSVPSLIIEGKYVINGAIPYDKLKQFLVKLLDEKKKEEAEKPIGIDSLDATPAKESCNFMNGKWNCN